METSLSQGLLCFNSGDNWSHKFINRPKSQAPMASASIPAVNCSESDTGWFAELIQMARHCDTANRTSAKLESTRMKSETISVFLTLAFCSCMLLRPMVQGYRSSGTSVHPRQIISHCKLSLYNASRQAAWSGSYPALGQ